MFCLPLAWIVGVFVSLSTNLSKFWNWFESLRQVITSYHTCSSKSSFKIHTNRDKFESLSGYFDTNLIKTCNW